MEEKYSLKKGRKNIVFPFFKGRRVYVETLVGQGMHRVPLYHRPTSLAPHLQLQPADHKQGLPDSLEDSTSHWSIEELNTRLLFDSHETSPIIWIGKPASAIQC